MSVPGFTKPFEAKFVEERVRLLAILGALVEGGIVEQIQHIGSSSIPGLPVPDGIDIALSIWPFPLGPQHLNAMKSCGYELVPGIFGDIEQRFRHKSGLYQLFIIEAGSERWADTLILRDYLRQDEAARQAYANQKKEWAAKSNLTPDDLQAAKAQYFDSLLPMARRWWIDHSGFGPVEAVAGELEGLSCPWYISSGWALDLFMGRVQRVHLDVDVVMAYEDQLELQRHLTGRGWKFLAPHENKLQPWPDSTRLTPPRHQVHAHRGDAFIDFLLSDIREGVWRYRREPGVLRTVERMGLQTPDGIPFLAPELVLLFKSKNTSGRERSKDPADFERVLPHLRDPERRAWLLWALTATDPYHPWIQHLGEEVQIPQG